MVLIVVLVVILLLTLGAYTFTTVMLAEADASRMYHRDAQARALADSGIELVAAILGDRAGDAAALNLYDNPQLFAGGMIVDDPDPVARGRFTVVAPLEIDVTGTRLRYGLIDESSKLNLNTLSESGLSARRKKAALMRLPGMTEDVADAILDWLDPDDEARQNGAEVQYYAALDPPYTPRNGRIESLDELLLVRGVTPWSLYGTDANRNGLLDPDEDLGDGTVNFGWAAFLTVHSRETNRRPDGSPKIDVNQEDLAALYDALAAAFDDHTATFIVAYRMYGPESTGSPSGSGGRSGSQGGSGSQQGGGQQSGGQQDGGTGTSSRTPIIRGTIVGIHRGFDVSGGGSTTITSLFDLVDALVPMPDPPEGEDPPEDEEDVGYPAREDQTGSTLLSPWQTDNPDTLDTAIARAQEMLATSTDEFIEGRVNILRARREVLLGIPRLREDVVEAILGAQAAIGSAGVDPSGSRGTTAWLLGEGLVDLETMRRLDRFITARGDVFRVQVVGFAEGGGPVSRQEATIDATQFPPRILSVRDLTGLGRGYTIQELLP
ncbi:MAG: hypothetical protein WED34_04585 [Planctomycetales bacterium]